MNAGLWLARHSRWVALFGLAAAVAGLSPHFLGRPNLVNVARETALLSMTAMGMTLAMIAGGIDLSVGSVAALSGCVAAAFLVKGQVGAGIAAGLAVGAACGSLSGLMVARLRLPAFVATYGMMQIARGAAVAFTGGYSIYGWHSERFAWLGKGFLAGLPAAVWVAAALVTVLAGLTSFTTYGRALYAAGANREAAEFSGLPVARATMATYVLSGGLSAFTGLVFAARVGAAEATMGELWPLDAIGAAVIGGTPFSGGEGSVTGTVLGAAILSVLGNALNLLGVSSYWQVWTKGFVIVLAVLVDVWLRRRASAPGGFGRRRAAG